MNKIKQLSKCIREYKKPTIITFVLIILEAVIETFIPFITANLVNNIKAGASTNEILETGIFLIFLAALSLMCGACAGFTCAKASAGFAKNIRNDVFTKIQSFSFFNIDKFSTASLVTRLTTDVNNVQMSYMMIIRTAIRKGMVSSRS